jgi:hypothetical protein
VASGGPRRHTQKHETQHLMFRLLDICLASGVELQQPAFVGFPER